MRLIYVALAWIGGILFAAASPYNAGLLWLIIAVVSATLAITLRRFSPLVIGAAALGILRFDALSQTNNVVRFNDSGTVTLEGVIALEPDSRDTSVQVRVDVDNIFQNGDLQNVSGVVLVSAPATFDGAYGDRIRATGILETPPEGDRFSYADYLARSEIYSIMPRARVTIQQQAARTDLRSHLIELKLQAKNAIARYLPEPYAGLLTGILLGDERGLSPELRDAFAETGAAHVIAISGFNMAILGGFISRTLRRFHLAPLPTAVVSVIVIAAYSLFVGASPGVVRAAFMTGLVLIGDALRRKSYTPTSLAFAALILSAVDPLVLWDIGFQLSVFAVLGLALFAQPFASFHDWLFSGLPPILKPISALLRDSVAVSLAALTFTLPLSALAFGRLSPAVLIVNALIVPVQPALMLLGGLAVGVSAVFPALAQIIFWVDMLPLAWTTSIVRLFSELPDVVVYPSPMWIATGFGLIIAGAMVRATHPEWASEILKNWSRSRQIVFGLVIASAVLCAIAFLLWRSRPDGLLHFWFLDLGSTSLLVQTPDGAHMLIDGGTYPSRLLGALGDRLPFNDRNIELQFITQPDEALLAALPVVYERYQARQVILNGALSENDSLLQLHDRLKLLPQKQAVAGETFRTSDNVTVAVVYTTQLPLDGSSSAIERDANALVLHFSYGQVSMLYTGDLSPDGQHALMTSGTVSNTTILGVPHAAARNALAEGFVSTLNPQIAIVQGDSLDRRVTPDPETLAQLHTAQVFRTDLSGTIHLFTDGHEVWVEVERNPDP